MQTQTTSPFDATTTRLVRAFAAFGVVPAAAVAVVVAIVTSPLWGLLAFVVVALLWALVVVLRARGALARVLRAIGSSPGRPGQHPRWENVVEGLGLSGGVHEPELHYLDATTANAAALVQGRRVVLVATTGLVETLGPVEQEAVAANLLCRVRDGSARYATVTAGLLGPLLGRVQGADRLVAEGLGDQRAVRSDLAAVGLTRFPPGLSRALSTMSRIGTELPDVDPATTHLWVAPATAVAPEASAVAATAQQPLEFRVAVLDEL